MYDSSIVELIKFIKKISGFFKNYDDNWISIILIFQFIGINRDDKTIYPIIGIRTIMDFLTMSDSNNGLQFLILL